MKSQRRVGGVCIALALAGTLAACGSTSSATTGPTTSSSTSSPAGASTSSGSASSPAGMSSSIATSAAGGSAVAFDSPEANLPTIKVPKIIPGTKCSIGYQNVFAAVPALKAEQDAAQKEAERLGCTFRPVDDQATPVNQVNHMNQFIAQNVNAIVVFPNVSTALAPSVATAVGHGIFVLGENAPPQVGVLPLDGYSTNGVQGVDTETYLRVKSIAEKSPGASVALLGLGAPVQVVTYYTARTKYWADKFGLNVLGEVDAQADSPAGVAPAMSAILAKYPKVQAVFAYNDTAAVASSAIAASSGRKDILISGGDGSANAIEAIKAGAVFNTVQPQILTRGTLLMDAAYDLITKQNLPLPKTFGVPVKLITQANAADATPIG